MIFTDFAQLKRFAYTPFGTFGYFTFHDILLYTVERPWDNNAPFSSCIPEDAYTVQRHQSPKFGASFILSGATVSHYKGDKERYGILIHPANRSSELQGCIAPGQDLMDSGWAVRHSRKAMADLHDIAPDSFALHITQWTPLGG